MEMKGKGGIFPFRFVWVIPVAALATVFLGIWGWEAHHASADDAVYRSLALFEINNESYISSPGSDDWRFRVARWTGAAAVITSLLAVAALLHEQLATALARWTRQAVVVIGAGSLAPGAFDMARRQRHSALWLGAPSFGTQGLRGIALEWPAGDRAQSVSAHAGKADHVLVVGDDDAEAMALAKAARKAAPTAQMTLVLNDPRLADEVALTLSDPKTRVMAFGDIAARALHAAHPPFVGAHATGQKRIHALILGFGATGQAIFHDLIINCRTTRLAKPRIVVIDPSAKALEGVLRVKAPELDECVEAVFIDGEIGGAAVRPQPAEIGQLLREGGDLTVAYVCLGDDPGALSAAAMLRSLLRATDVKQPHVYVRLREAEVLAGSAETRSEGLKGLTAFGDIQAVLTACEFLADQPDALARRYHDTYQLASGGVREPWDSLRETHRIANRGAVGHIAAKIASGGFDPTPAPDGLPKLPAGARLCPDDVEMERFAWLEHERWNAERRMDGWRRAPIDEKQDPVRRTHPYLRAFGELAADIQFYDWAFVDTTNTICGGQPMRGPGYEAWEAHLKAMEARLAAEAARR